MMQYKTQTFISISKYASSPITLIYFPIKSINSTVQCERTRNQRPAVVYVLTRQPTITAITYVTSIGCPKTDSQQCFVIILIATRNSEAKIFTAVQ